MASAPHCFRSPLRPYRAPLFALIGFCCLNGVVALHARTWRSYDPRFARDRIRYGRRHTWDLVVVGGSPAMAGINSACLKSLPWHDRLLQRSYNLAIPLATAAEIFHSLEHGLSAPPQLVVYGIAVTDFNDMRVEAMDPEELMEGGDVLRWTRWRRGEAEWCVRRWVGERSVRLFPLYYYREGIRRWAAARAERAWPGFCPEAAHQAAKGLENATGLRRCYDFSPARPVPPYLRFDLKKAAGELPCRVAPMENYRLDGYLPYLEAIIDWCAEHGADLVLVDIPVPADLERLYPQALAAYRATLLQMQRRRGLLLMTPTREQVGLTEADFDDMIHLNGDGNARFSDWLRRALSQRGGVPSVSPSRSRGPVAAGAPLSNGGAS